MTRSFVLIAALAAFAVLGSGCATAGGEQSVQDAYASYQQQAPSPSPAAAPVAVPAPVPAVPTVPGAEPVTVARVIDGDTFEVADGRTIRVLGIDACEADTPGGDDATARAREVLTEPGNTVTLTREPGVDTDRYDRELRYVQYVFGSSPDLGVNDFGEFMVGYYHTGVYQGRNDASDAYVAMLRDADQYTGRNCSSDPVPATSTEDDDDVYVYRGGDDGESRFCSRRAWC